MNQSLQADRQALAVRRLGIEQFPGISQPFELDGLGPGINVIHGPNAIGKSRTAAAIMGLVWPELLDPNTAIKGAYSIGDDEWSVERRYGQSHYQRNSQPDTRHAAGIVPASQHDRYLLTLHGLLQADDREFAQHIRRESAGGYDLAEIRKAIGLSNTLPRPGASRQKRAYDEATRTVGELRRQDAALQARDRSRNELEAQRRKADQAIERHRLLVAVREYVAAIRDRREAEIAVDAFDAPVSRLTGEENDLVREHESRIVDLEREQVTLTQDVERLQRELRETGLGDRLPSEADLTRLARMVADLAQAESSIQQSASALAEHQARLAETRRRISPNISDSQLHQLDSDGLRTLGMTLRRQRDLANEVSAQRAVAEWLGDTNAPEDLDRLRRSMELMVARIRHHGASEAAASTSRMRLALLASAVMILMLAIALAVLQNPVWGAAAVTVVPIAWLALRQPGDHADALTSQLDAELASSGIALPSPATTDQILQRFDELRVSLAAATLQSEKAQRWQGLENRRTLLVAQQGEIASEVARQREQFGVSIAATDPEEIRTLADAIDRWRQATEHLQASVAQGEVLASRLEALFATFNAEIREYGETTASTSHDASARTDSLSRRAATARQSLDAINRAQVRLDTVVNPAVEEERKAVRDLYRRAGLETPDPFRLHDLCGQVEGYRAALKRLADARVVEQTRRLPVENTGYAEHLPSMAELESQIAIAEGEASRRDSILADLTRLDADIERARAQTALEEANERQTQALQELHDQRNRDLAQLAAWHVTDFIQRQTRDLSRPAVFHQARSLFSQFTAGSWRLELAEGHDATFLAVETSTNRTHTLEQLSSGTRVQLLMAVRVAFIEASEFGLQLPLIMDETLGNADDLRANAIIDATLTLARNGRQVLYFTAQQDEIVKWKSRAEEIDSGATLTLIDLEAARTQRLTRATSRITWVRAPLSVPTIPDGATHEDLRDLLRVSPIDLWADHDDGVDLWYLIPESESLMSLRSQRIQTWGQYRELRQYQGTAFLTRSSDLDTRCEARAQIIQLLRKHWQQGRPRPLTREALLAVPSVSDRFRDELVALAESLDWSAEALLRALRDRKIPRFQNQVIIDIEVHCQENGYLTDAIPIDDEMLRAIVRSGAQPFIENGAVTPDEIDAFLDLLATT